MKTPLLLLPACVAGISLVHAEDPAVTLREFIYEKAPYPECHASTLVETPTGLVAAWFGGKREKDPSVGIWLAHRKADGWTEGVEVADGNQPDGKRLPCWNPVLFQVPGKELLLFYKVGPSPSTWWGMLKRSGDGGRTWSAAEKLPDGILGPIKNKPVLLSDGALLCPASTESDDAVDAWRLAFYRSTDLGRTWTTAVPARPADGREIDAIQPSVLFHDGGKLQAVGRTRAKRVFETCSTDQGQTWTAPALLDVPNPNSGTDALTLKDGRHVLVCNPVEKGRSPLSVLVSRDGKSWQPAATLETEKGEFSYPAVIQTADGAVHVTYTWKRQKIRHVVLRTEALGR